MVEIKCLRCKEEFQIGKEQLLKIKEIVIGKTFKPKDYLRFFPLISGECVSGKGHDFVFTDAFSDKKKEIIQEYDETGKHIETLRESLKLMEDKEKELGLEKEKLVGRLDEIRDELFALDGNINDISLGKIPEDLVRLGKLLYQFEELCGTRDIDTWKGVVVARVENKTKTVETVPKIT